MKHILNRLLISSLALLAWALVGCDPGPTVVYDGECGDCQPIVVEAPCHRYVKDGCDGGEDPSCQWWATFEFPTLTEDQVLLGHFYMNTNYVGPAAGDVYKWSSSIALRDGQRVAFLCGLDHPSRATNVVRGVFPCGTCDDPDLPVVTAPVDDPPSLSLAR